MTSTGIPRACALKDRGVSVPEIAKKLTVRTGKTRASTPRSLAVPALAEAEEVDPPAGPEIIARRRPTRAGLTGPGSNTDPNSWATSGGTRSARRTMTDDDKAAVIILGIICSAARWVPQRGPFAPAPGGDDKADNVARPGPGKLRRPGGATAGAGS
ncbi:hypothetical protein GCM10010521_15730 [Streptomyces rameus]|uniref:Uncharacterized protein n=1 Tax=Streptomyces rameus TaxID=68261 RepID=A0ABP6N3A2_9ACTN